MNFISQPKTSYLHRMAVLSSVSICSKNLNQNLVSEHVVANLLKNIKDKIPNVRFYLIKLLSQMGPYVDTTCKDKIKA